ncbi:MAG: transposase [Methanobrevibacter sp.]|jgi:transposase-like protein|nr:transposase [Methanobrevibacter sp.]
MDKFVMTERDVMMIYHSIRWANGVYCPKCQSFSINRRGSQSNSFRYTCKKCGLDFSDFTNTPFEYSKIPFSKIIYILTHIGTIKVFHS